MAQLELASLLAPAPASGASGSAVGALPTETSAATTDTALSFSQLLAGTPQSPATPLAPGQIAADLAARSTTNNPPLPSPTPTVNDPASLEQAVQLLTPTALAEGLVPTTDGAATGEPGKSGKAGKAGELDSEDIGNPGNEQAAEAAWLGWPLFLESRAALRDSRTLGAEHLPSPSAETVLTESTLDGIGASSTQFAPLTPCVENSAELTHSSESPLPSSIQQNLITDYQGHRASTQMLGPMFTASAGVDSLVSASPTQGLLAGLTPTPLSTKTDPSASEMLQAADLAVALSKISPTSAAPTLRQTVPNPAPAANPPAVVAKPASTTVLSGAVSSGSNVPTPTPTPTPSSADLPAILKAATSAQPPASGITASVTTSPITATTETVLTQPADAVASPLLVPATGNEKIDWQRRLAQSLTRTRQPGAVAESASPSGDSLKSLSGLAAKSASDAIDSETGTIGATARPTIPFHGSQTETKSTVGAGLQRRPLFTMPIAASHNQPLTEEPTTAITRSEMDDKAPWDNATATNKRVQIADSSPAMADPESAVSASLETRWNASTPVTSSVATSERIADSGATIRMVESTSTVAAPAARADSPAASPPRSVAPSPSAPLPTAPDVLDMQQKNWERTLARQLDWAVNNRFQEAEIKVNPPDLGPLEMRLTLHHNQTSVMFFSHEAAVREALETALPRLRELLDNLGITLNQAQVSDQSLARHQANTGEQAGYGQRERNRTPSPADAEVPVETAQPRSRSRNLRGAVDDYA